MSGECGVRIGAVTYLNARPLTWCLAQALPKAEIVYDLPSRLADGLVGARFDVALIPTVEYFRLPGATIVSDACISAEGPVKSVKVYGRVPPGWVRTLALDEGSRTSAAMTRILFKERFGLAPAIEKLPIGAAIGDTAADAVMLVGDRGLLPPEGEFRFVWDLGGEWLRWTGLPFVFAMWIARPGLELGDLGRQFGLARDEGVRQIEEIARQEAPTIGVSEQECLTYLRDHLVFHLGERQRAGLETFRRLAVCHGLVGRE